MQTYVLNRGDTLTYNEAGTDFLLNKPLAARLVSCKVSVLSLVSLSVRLTKGRTIPYSSCKSDIVRRQNTDEGNATYVPPVIVPDADHNYQGGDAERGYKSRRRMSWAYCHQCVVSSSLRNPRGNTAAPRMFPDEPY